MEGKGASPATQLNRCDAYKTLTLGKPVRKTVTVSAAAIFKNRGRGGIHQGQTDLQNLQKPATKIKKIEQKEEPHPLTLDFKETSREYRRQLFANADAKINKDLDTMLNKLYKGNLQVASSDRVNDDPQASPIKLTISANYQRLAQNLCRPLSSYHYRPQVKNSSGEKVELALTNLHDRFQSFEELVQVETEQIKVLQSRWEGVVAEIFQLGGACLGTSDIAALLFTAETGLEVSSPTSKAESTLFVPVHNGPDKKAGKKRKRKSFACPDMTMSFPPFLLNASEHREVVPATPDLPLGDIEDFKKDIAGLGSQHVVDLKQVEEGYKTWWEDKQKHLAQLLMED